MGDAFSVSFILSCAETIINVIKIWGIGISTIFHAVFRYLPFSLAVLQYWVPPTVPLSKDRKGLVSTEKKSKDRKDLVMREKDK